MGIDDWSFAILGSSSRYSQNLKMGANTNLRLASNRLSMEQM